MPSRRLILNCLPMRLVFHRSKDAFAIMASGNAHSVKLSEAVLCARKVQLSHHKFAEIQQELEKNVVSYSINHVHVKTHSITAGLTSLSWYNLILGQLPNRIFLGMVDNDSYTGYYKKNSFNFKHFDVREVAVYVNGKTLSQPLKLNFEDGEYLEGYPSLFKNTGKMKELDYQEGSTLMDIV